MTLSHRKKTVGKQATTASSPPGDSKIKRRKRCVAHTSFIDGASPSSALKRPAKIQWYKKPQLLDSMRARLGPQEPRKPRSPVTTTWGAHRDPMITPMVQNVHPHLAVRQAGRNLPNEPPIGSISKRLDDMLSMPFCSHIIHYEPQGDSSCLNSPRNDALLCKVFPANLQGQTLSWFHRLPPNSVDNFKDLSEAFVGQYLCSARHKQNISTLQNIKMQDNESLREFVKRFGQAVLQVEAYSMDAVLQIFKRSICPSTPFFESLAKKPPTTMDDLFRCASKYSMLEDDIRATT
ncbi:hypothetical protein CK203_098045 [Vitis vinifera]|uniref:Retrotransposon gag domain-containing protein n=1 Tax=Vitis vinifera TaxID=29760 RepID=A0A438CS39_VITVI|nr:hypothetical protein CK203_098045 [Vitis vinifera]